MCLSQYAVPVEARRVFWVSGAEAKGPCGIPDIGAGYWTLILYKSSKYSLNVQLQELKNPYISP